MQIQLRLNRDQKIMFKIVKQGAYKHHKILIVCFAIVINYFIGGCPGTPTDREFVLYTRMELSLLGLLMEIESGAKNWKVLNFLGSAGHQIQGKWTLPFYFILDAPRKSLNSDCDNLLMSLLSPSTLITRVTMFYWDSFQAFTFFYGQWRSSCLWQYGRFCGKTVFRFFVNGSFVFFFSL